METKNRTTNLEGLEMKTKEKTLKLNRKEFRRIFIQPLEKYFGYETFWSGKESERAGLGKVTGKSNGFCFINLTDAPIVISLRSNQQDTLRTLVHEYAHSILHRVGTEGHFLDKAEKEIEAETVAKYVILNLGLEYTNDLYIPIFESMFTKKTGKNYTMSCSRRNLVNNAIFDITEALKHTKDMALNLIGKGEVQVKKSSYKYEVCCPTCNNSWKYKTKGKTVKNAHNYFCLSCGRGTKGKFIVKEL